jgi:hypothetical protein
VLDVLLLVGLGVMVVFAAIRCSQSPSGMVTRASTEWPDVQEPPL